MIKINLAVIMAERNMNISTLSKKTGISRNALSGLLYNTAKGIQFETLEKICDFFGIQPGDLMSKIYFNIKVLSEEMRANGITHSLRCKFYLNDDEFEGGLLCEDWEDESGKIHFRILMRQKLLNRLPFVPPSQISLKLIEHFESRLNSKYKDRDINPDIVYYDDDGELEEYFKDEITYK